MSLFTRAVVAVSLLAIFLGSAVADARADDAADFQQLKKQYDQQMAAYKYSEAAATAGRMRKIAEGKLSSTPATLILAIGCQALVLEAQAKYREAEPLRKWLVSRLEKLDGPEHLDVAASLRALASVYMGLGRYSEAEPLLKRAVAICEKARGPEYISVAGNVGTLALVYREQGRYAEAEPLFKRAIAINEKAVGPEHLWVADWLGNLAGLYDIQGRYAEAEPLYKRSQAIREKQLGPEHPAVAASLAGRAFLYWHQGRYAEGETLSKRSLAIVEKALGPEHPRVAAAVNDLALVYVAEGRYVEAEPLFKRSLAIREKILGARHLDVAQSLNNLALSYVAQGRYAEAEPFFKRSMTIKEERLGAEHPRVAISLVNLADLYRAQGRYAEAEPLLKRGLAIYEKMLGPEHPDVATSLNGLGSVCWSQGRYAEAEPLLKRGLAIREKALGPEHPRVAQSLDDLAVVYRDQGRYAEAEPLLKRGLAIRRKALGPEHPDVANGLKNLALLYRAQGRYDEAEPFVDQAIALADRAGIAPGRRFAMYALRAQINWRADQRGEALRDLRQAMQLAEQQRAQSSGGEQERAETFSTFGDAFEQMVAWQVELKDMGEALDAIERGRARSLLDEMFQAGVDLNVGRSSVEREALQKHEQELNEQVGALEKQIEALADDKGKTAEEKLAKRQTLQESLAQARKALYEHYRDQRAASPVYRQLLSTGSGPPRLRQIQARLAEKDGLLLVYLLGSEGGYVLSVSGEKTQLSSLTLGIEAARRLGVKPGPLTAGALANVLVNAEGTGVLQQLRDAHKAGKATDKLAVLWEVLLPKAEREAIVAGKYKRLMVVPDGKLAMLPFEALVVRAGKEPKYLLDVGPAIHYGPSATVLYNLSQPVAAADSSVREPVLTLGNPDYSGGQLAARPDDALGQVAVNSRYGGLGGKLAPLPYSGWESTWVADAFHKAGIGAVRLEGAEATKARLQAMIEGRRIIHLACHGLADQSYGNLFGALALTAGAAGQPEDGFLTLKEIYALNLKGCELTILSACETNFGPQQQGEGVWALSRGFLVAGSRRVVASNWLVDDEAAATLISYYCSNLAQAQQKGQTVDYAESLRKAKLGVRKEEKWSSPYYWSSLVLVGPK